MSPTDPRHGTTAGAQKHTRDHERRCDPCRIAATAARNARRLERIVRRCLGCGRTTEAITQRCRTCTIAPAPDDELTGGRWVQRGWVQVWVNDEEDAA